MFNRKPPALGGSGVFIDPFALVNRVTSDFERMFEGSDWPVFRGRSLGESAAWSPSLDLVEKDKRLIARVDLPGMKKEDVKVEVAEGYLTISGERKHETEEKKENFYRCEREYGSFYRAIPLPEDAQVEEVKAAFNNGVLEVSVPLTAARLEAKPRTIQIEEAGKVGKAA
jgi:HSP20 family protein